MIHTGNIRDHVVKKVREILKEAKVPAIVVCQTTIDFEDFARGGVQTRLVRPKKDDILTEGRIMDIVSGVTRGQSCPRDKLNELVISVKTAMRSIESN